jgi:hypothetical protein
VPRLTLHSIGFALAGNPAILTVVETEYFIREQYGLYE